MMILLSVLASLSLLSSDAEGMELVVLASDADGAPLANAVVTLPAPDGFDAESHQFDWPMMMQQQDIQFDPHVLVAPRGAQVEFPNRDRVRHHVYSFSGRNAFELQLYGREEARLVGFGHPGAVVLGCNIHDEMIGYIRVVDTPYALKTDADGRAVLSDAPDGPLSITLWHPYATSSDGTVTVELDAQARAAGPVRVTIPVRRPQ